LIKWALRIISLHKVKVRQADLLPFNRYFPDAHCNTKARRGISFGIIHKDHNE